MDEKIDKLIDLCGTKNKYQYILLFIAFICWINNMMVSIALPFLEKTPEVTFIDPITKEIKKDHLNYTICKWNKSTYNISENYDYSWVIYFNISCDQIKTGLIGSFNFAGSFLGSISLNFFADNFGRKYSIIFSFLLYIIFNTLIVFMTNYYLVIAINFLFCSPQPSATKTAARRASLRSRLSAWPCRGALGRATSWVWPPPSPSAALEPSSGCGLSHSSAPAPPSWRPRSPSSSNSSIRTDTAEGLRAISRRVLDANGWPCCSR